MSEEAGSTNFELHLEIQLVNVQSWHLFLETRTLLPEAAPLPRF